MSPDTSSQTWTLAVSRSMMIRQTPTGSSSDSRQVKDAADALEEQLAAYPAR